jgi:PilZ domain-containing protein
MLAVPRPARLQHALRHECRDVSRIPAFAAHRGPIDATVCRGIENHSGFTRTLCISSGSYTVRLGSGVTNVLFPRPARRLILGSPDENLLASRFQVPMWPTNRASRYPLEMTIRYRSAGADRWLEGETLNISDSGVLFQTPEPPPDLEVFLEMALEMSAFGPRLANVTCTGRVVRTMTAVGSGTRIAVTIDRYNLARSAS